MADNILNGKRILAVDDEPDVLETLEDLLEDYEGLTLDQAMDYDTGYHLLRSWTYDAVILDIMGVRGFDLLSASVHLGFPTVMLTAHALSSEALKQSIEMGARAYVPKEKMMDIPDFLEDVMSLEHGGSVKKKRFSVLADSSIRSSAQNGWRTKRPSGKMCKAGNTYRIR